MASNSPDYKQKKPSKLTRKKTLAEVLAIDSVELPDKNEESPRKSVTRRGAGSQDKERLNIRKQNDSVAASNFKQVERAIFKNMNKNKDLIPLVVREYYIIQYLGAYREVKM